jgi:PASTA domain
MTDDDLDPTLDARFKALDRLDPADVWNNIVPAGAGGGGRRRLTFAAVVAFAALVVTGLTISRWSSGSQDEVVATGTAAADERQESTSTSTGVADVLIPDVVGLSLADADNAIENLGLRPRVIEGDPDFGAALVLAQEPGAGLSVRVDDIVGLRTVVPDPPPSLECPGGQYPRGDVGLDSADALPPLEGVSRANAEEAVVEIRARLDNTVLLGQWNRWAWQRVDGEVEVVPVEGFQVIVVADTSDCGPTVPSYFNGAPVTWVKGPLDDFVVGLQPTLAGPREVESTSLDVAEDLVAALRADGIDASMLPDPDLPEAGLIAGRPRRVCVAGGVVQVFEFDTEELRVAESSTISEVGQPANGIVEWAGTPRFFAAGRLLSLYVGDGPETVDALARVLGPTLSPRADEGRGEPGTGIGCDGEMQTVSVAAFGITFDIPAAWEPGQGGEEWIGDDGFVQVAARGAAGTIDELAEAVVGHQLAPYGTEPTIEELVVDRQTARLVMPSADGTTLFGFLHGEILATPDSALVIRGESYAYVTVVADIDHIREIAASIRWSP